MQSPKLPIQFNASPAPAPAAQRPAQGNGDAPFSAALSREVNQRQQTAMPAPVKEAPPAKADAAKASDAAPASAASAPEAGAARPAGAKDDGTDADAKAAADAAAAGAPALDMLALVASLQQPDSAAAAAAVAATAAPAAAAGGIAAPGIRIAATLQAAAAAAGRSGANANAMGKLDGKVLDRAPIATDGGSPLGQRVERVVEDAAPVQAQADPATGQPRGLSDATQFGALRAREAPPDAGALKELAVAAPTAAPLQQAALAVAQATVGAPTDRIAARVGTPGWDQQVGQKVVWMVAGQEQSASLTLNPPDMGPMQVVLSVTNDQASVTFSAAQPEVRQALEDAMPKLREMMNDAGIALGNASVNDHGAREQAEARQQAAAGSGRSPGGAVETVVPVPVRRASGASGMVDTFA